MRFAVALYAAAFVVGLSAVQTPDWEMYAIGMPDVAADKYLTRAAWDGYGSDRPLSELADHYGTGESVDKAVTRTPGALLIQAPLVAVPDAALVPLFAVATLTSFLFVCWAATRLSGLPVWVGGAVALLAAGPPPMRYAYMFGTTAVLAVALMCAGWVWKDRPWAAALFAVAAVLKVWPALIVLPLLRRRVGREAVMWILGLNVAGLLLPGASVTVGDWQTHTWNLSLVPIVGLPVAMFAGGCVFLLAWRAFADESRRMAVCVLVGLLVSPLSWPWYWVAAIPAAAVLLSERLPDRPTQPSRAVVDGEESEHVHSVRG